MSMYVYVCVCVFQVHESAVCEHRKVRSDKGFWVMQYTQYGTLHKAQHNNLHGQSLFVT